MRGARRARATIHEVAKAAGVSPATVSRVVNGRSTVDPELASRVREAIATTGYVTNPIGRALRRQSTNLWAAIIPDVQNPFFTGVVSALETTATRGGYAVMLCNTDENVGLERTYIHAVVAQQISGAVVAAASETATDLAPLFEAGIPVVTVDRRVHDYACDSVRVDNELAGRLVARRFLDLDLGRIAVLSGPRDVSTTEDRTKGLRDTLRDHGIDDADVLVRRTDLHAEDGYRETQNLLALATPPDAVYTTNGPLTAGAFRAIHEAGLRMPDELALVGTDNDQWTRMVSPDVAVIAQPVDEIGRLAGEMLVSRIAEPDRPVRTTTLTPSLLVRGSLARPVPEPPAPVTGKR